MTRYCTNIFPFPPGFQLLPTSPEMEKMETFPLQVSNFSLVSYRNKLHAGTCSISSLAPVQGVAPALPPGTFAPRAGAAAATAQPALAPKSVGESCKECPAPGEGVTLRNWNTTWQGNGLGNFYCPQSCQLFGVPLFLLHQLHFFPSQNGVSQQAVGKGH